MSQEGKEGSKGGSISLHANAWRISGGGGRHRGRSLGRRHGLNNSDGRRVVMWKLGGGC